MSSDNPGYRYRDDLRTMSDEVLFEELHDTWNHLRAAGLEADADLVNELAGRWLNRNRPGGPDLDV